MHTEDLSKNSLEKTCSRCRISKPLQLFVKAKHTRDRRRSHCLECHRAAMAARRAAQPALYLALARRSRLKHLDATRAKDRQRYANRSEEQRQKGNAQARARYEANLTTAREKGRLDAHKRRQLNPEPFRTATHHWRERHPEENRASDRRSKEKNREAINARARERRTENLDYFREKGRRDVKRYLHARHEANRRWYARKAQAPINDLTSAQWLEIQEAQDHHCVYCGRRAKGKLSQDHITPLSKGGSHTLQNVIAACQSCNSRKGARSAPVPVQPLLLTVALARAAS